MADLCIISRPLFRIKDSRRPYLDYHPAAHSGLIVFGRLVFQPRRAVVVLGAEAMLVQLMKIYKKPLETEQFDRFPEEMETRRCLIHRHCCSLDQKFRINKSPCLVFAYL